MANDYFSFKRFTVWQRRAAMRVGTDGVLLGAWFDPGGDGARMLDVGTGTGVIALMAGVLVWQLIATGKKNNRCRQLCGCRGKFRRVALGGTPGSFR